MPTVSGILNVNKPPGWTSHDVVAFVRGRSRVRRVGHAGTLDPAATGVLPILVGQATRLSEYLLDATKTYVASVELGVETDTYDRDGAIIATADASDVSRKDIDAALPAYRGEIEQVPPAYSAVKRDGVPLYRAARRGQAVEAPPRRVRVHRLEVLAYEPPFLRLEVDCGKGFYVRSLAHDLGARLGVGGMLAGLVRTRVGPFRLDAAVDVETLRVELETDAWRDRLYAPDEVLLGWRAAILAEPSTQRLRQGRSVSLEARAGIVTSAGDRCRAYDAAGEFVAVLSCAGEREWRPEKVFGGTENMQHRT